MRKVVNLDEVRRNKVLKRVLEQQEKGLSKYGKLVDPDEMSVDQWLEHYQQEVVDAHVYGEVLRQKLQSIAEKLQDALAALRDFDRWNDDSLLDITHVRIEETLWELGIDPEDL